MTFPSIPHALATVSLTTALLAGPPYLTDDPEPVERHHWEIYLFTQGVVAHGARFGLLPAFEANYGPFANAQIQFQIPVADEQRSDGTRDHGLGDLQAGFKYRFVQEGDLLPQIAVYPQVQAPTGKEEAGLGSGHWRVYVPVLFQKSFGPWTTYGGLGWWRNPGEGKRNHMTFGWQVQRSFGETFSAGTEIFHQGVDTIGGTGSTALNAGFIKSLGPRFAVLGTLGRVFHGETGHQVYLGVRGAF